MKIYWRNIPLLSHTRTVKVFELCSQCTVDCKQDGGSGKPSEYNLKCYSCRWFCFNQNLIRNHYAENCHVNQYFLWRRYFLWLCWGVKFAYRNCGSSARKTLFLGLLFVRYGWMNQSKKDFFVNCATWSWDT